MPADRRPLIVHADARPASQLSEERLGIGGLDCDLVASEDKLIANVRDADVVRGHWPKYVANPSVKPRWPLEVRHD